MKDHWVSQMKGHLCFPVAGSQGSCGNLAFLQGWCSRDQGEDVTLSDQDSGSCGKFWNSKLVTQFLPLLDNWCLNASPKGSAAGHW